MYQTIVVPIDGTPLAEAALPLAKDVARRAHARVHLVFSHQSVPILAAGAEMAAPADDVDALVREREHAYLDATTHRMARQGFPDVEALRTDGPPGRAVCDEIRRIRGDLVVMASHGRGALGRLWRGSVADDLVHRCGVPVLLLGPGIARSRLAVGGRILVAVDLTLDSERSLVPAADLARLFRAHITLLHVSGLTRYSPGSASPQARMDRLADRVRELGCSTSSLVVTDVTASAGILHELEDECYSVVVVNPHRSGLVRELFLGSTAHAVIRAAAVPVLVVGPGRNASPEQEN